MTRIGIVFALGALVFGLAGCSSSKKSEKTTTTAATTTTTPPTTSGKKPSNALTKADVVQMQEWLDAVGCDVGANDGVVGPLTLASLKSFQQGAGLAVDGVYGPKTKAALSADAQAKKQVCKKPTPPVPPVGPTGNGAACTAQAIQAGLNAAITTGYTVKLDGFGCDQGWAYAYATVTASSGESIDVTDVLAARDGAWVSQDRGVVCPSGKMPQDIYAAGCTSN
ncbi:MAG: peptidoglycan-binding domain-containing protein [Acidimicrobiia bacterium]